ncbi:MAG: hypothetical protein ACRD50_06635 [Candidatus Acidiferrales bacterium]
MREKTQYDRTILVHTAGTVSEAMVIRALLESNGIAAPGSISADPFPLRDVPQGSHGVEIIVLESQSDLARRIIAEFLTANEAPDSASEIEETDASSNEAGK